jgi:exodeoxyribonuclease VII large subunit
MVPAGLGDMHARFEALKRKLQAEGLFANEAKKKLPPYPQKIGIVTSPTSAALQDVMNILRRRFPVEAVVYPALVQGAEAPPSLIKGIRYFNEVLPVDLIILTRGGGSQEDLWCFNDEALARAIFASRIPMISAVGHEIDFSISDFVADLRAPTPSAAAEIAVPNKDDLKAYCGSLEQRLSMAISHSLGKTKAQINEAGHRLSGYHPQRLWQDYQQRFDMATMALSNIKHLIKEPQYRLERYQSKLMSLKEGRVMAKVSDARYRLNNYGLAIRQSAEQTMQKQAKRLELLEEVLRQQSPKGIMQKGWLLAMKDGHLLRSINDVKIGDTVQLHIYDGQADVNIVSKKQDA